MKRIIRLTESELAGLIKRIIKENEEEWISSSSEMDLESDYSKVELEKKALEQAEDATKSLSKEEKKILNNFINSVSPEEFTELIEDEINNLITEDEQEDSGMSEEEYQVRKIIDKVIRRVSVISFFGIVPAAMFISGGVAAALGAVSLAAMLLKDVAWWNPKGYDKNQTSIHHGKANRARREDGEGRNPYINEMEDEDFMKVADKNWEDSEHHGTMRSRFFDDEDEGDEEWGQSDIGEEDLQDLIEEARDFLENECGYDLHDLNLMSEEDIVDALYDEGNDELAIEIEELLNQEGF